MIAEVGAQEILIVVALVLFIICAIIYIVRR